MISAELLCSRLLRIPHIRDAATLAVAGDAVVTVLLVRQGYRPGPVLRDLTMQAAESTGEDLRVAIVDAIPRRADGVVDEAAADALLAEKRSSTRTNRPRPRPRPSSRRWSTNSSPGFARA